MLKTNALEQLKLAIDLCFREGLIAPTLALVYSGMDTLAWLGVPEGREDVTREDFVSWTDRYLLPDSGITCTALDLYSSRCGILHSMSSESRATRQGVATKVFYTWGSRRAEDLQNMIDWAGQSALAIQVDTLLYAFKEGFDRFLEASERDPVLGQRVSDRLDKIFTNVQDPEEANAGS